MFNLIILLTEHFVIPAVFTVWLWKRLYKSKFDAIFMALLVGVYIHYIYRGGEWHLFGYYFRYFWGAAFLVALLRMVYQLRSLPFWSPKTRKEKFGLYFMGFFSAVFLGLGIWACRGTTFRGEAVSLSFPLKNGNFYVIEGGDSPVINNHHRFFPVPEKFSLEVVKLDNAGRYARGFFPEELTAYFAFGEKVYSPCTGIVVSVIDSLPDLPPSELAGKEDVFPGNQVIIDHGGVWVYLSRLKLHSISVQPGDTVHTGQLLGEIGNSGLLGGPFGLTAAPHLHIQATRKSGPENSYYEREGVAMLFGGKFLAKNTLIETL
ncbi:MAG: M23 family metallopeptidase [Calditrichaceae bacterium]|nr:M23 family metallopeptidase [Calditrichia bacterium]NUQ41347.1 M23 family metallopeptidase [Calditrichaceae bacterium]